MRLTSRQETRDLANGLRTLLTRHAPAHYGDEFWSRSHLDLWGELASGGWLLAGVPEAVGGAGLDLLDLCELAAVWGEYLFPIPYLPTLVIRRWAMPISNNGDGPMTFAVDTAEPRILYGSAPLLKCLRSVDEDGALRVSRVRADAAAGFAPSLPLGRGKIVSAAPENFWAEAFTLLAAGAVGAARVAIRDSVEYAKTRSAYDRPIAHYQGVSHRLADMHRDTELAWTAIVWAAHGESDILPAIDAALRLAQAVVEAAIQIHGGIGFTWEMKLHFYLRHVIVLRRLTPVG